MRRIYGKSAAAFLLGMAIWLVPPVAAEDDPVYGPRFEVGAGLERVLEQNQPDWAADVSNHGMGIISMRVFKGLSVQAGLSYGASGNPKADSLSLGSSPVAHNIESFSNSSWAGIRYELPMSVLKQNILGIYSIYGGLGVSWATYSISSTETNGTSTEQRSFDVADLRGPYALAGIRWRIDASEPGAARSWLSAYGVDVGAKYVRYNESDLRYSGIQKPSSDFSSARIFAVAFVKFDIAD